MNNLPIKTDHKTLTFHRPPTQYEIRFGEGATHYKDFSSKDYLNKQGQVKKWLKCSKDGLRYYY